MDSEQIPAVSSQQPCPTTPYEAEFVAARMADHYARMVEFSRRELGLTPEDAEKHARETTEWDIQRVTAAPVDHLTWFSLQSVMDHDPTLGLAGWERIKQSAWDELQTGHRAASVFDWDSGPWDRAQFLAIRAAFREEWQPRGGIEDALIDIMAQCHSEWLAWMHQHFISASTEAKVQAYQLKKDGRWETPRVEVGAWIEQAAGAAERYNRMFLRTLRALRDLRRYSPTVIVQSAGQVNVGTVQTNVAPAGDTQS
jgi:hypothetical protein